MLMKIGTALAIVATLGACARAVPRPDTLTPGPRPSDDQAERAVREYLARVLKDPDSMKQFRITRGPYAREWQDTRWTPWAAGWVVCYELNAKNSAAPSPPKMVLLSAPPSMVSLPPSPQTVSSSAWVVASSA